MSETSEPAARFHAIVEGRVQGVGFRYFVVEQAQHFGVNGWGATVGMARVDGARASARN
jgi:acylphosphatase